MNNKNEKLFLRVDISKKKEDIGKTLYTNMSFPSIYKNSNKKNIKSVWLSGMIDYDIYKKELEKKRIPTYLKHIKPKRINRKEINKILKEDIHPDEKPKVLSEVERIKLDDLERHYFKHENNVLFIILIRILIMYIIKK